MQKKQIYPMCTEHINAEDLHYLQRFQKNLKKRFNKTCFFHIIRLILVELVFVILFSIVIGGFSFQKLLSFYPVFLFIAGGYLLFFLVAFLSHKKQQRFINKALLHYNSTVLVCPDNYIFISKKRESFGNSSGSGKIETVRFKKQQHISEKPLSFGKSDSHFIYDTLTKGEIYRFYKIHEKYIFIVCIS